LELVTAARDFRGTETIKRGAPKTMRAWCLVLILLVATPAAAQQLPVQSPRAEQSRARIWREPPGPVRQGRLGMPVAGNLEVAVGRFSGPQSTRPHTHTEPISRIADISRRERGRAAVGLSLRF
jgi:hypothetical protein